ncbi:MAG: SDR family oxidoreductase [Gammaproteobacteria bacterium]|nr:SDR family oxidoreductase [Gammaproteobacteria bacterium]
MEESLNILIVGATGGTGRAIVERLLHEGHNVTAFSRSANLLESSSERLATINGDATNQGDLDQAVRGQDVVIITLGISENPFRVRFFGAKGTPADVRSVGTRNVIAAMKKQHVQRLIVQSSYGVGETQGLLRFADQLFFGLILKPQIEDTETQERVVRSSGLDWTIAQPVHLTDGDSARLPFLSTKGETRAMKVARQSVAQALFFTVREPGFIGKSVAISG